MWTMNVLKKCLRAVEKCVTYSMALCVFILRHKNQHVACTNRDMYTQHPMMKSSHFFPRQYHYIEKEWERKKWTESQADWTEWWFFSSLVSMYLFAHNIESWHLMSHWSGMMSLYYNFSLFFWAIKLFLHHDVEILNTSLMFKA